MAIQPHAICAARRGCLARHAQRCTVAIQSLPQYGAMAGKPLLRSGTMACEPFSRCGTMAGKPRVTGDDTHMVPGPGCQPTSGMGTAWNRCGYLRSHTRMESEPGTQRAHVGHSTQLAPRDVSGQPSIGAGDGTIHPIDAIDAHSMGFDTHTSDMAACTLILAAPIACHCFSGTASCACRVGAIRTAGTARSIGTARPAGTTRPASARPAGTADSAGTSCPASSRPAGAADPTSAARAASAHSTNTAGACSARPRGPGHPRGPIRTGSLTSC